MKGFETMKRSVTAILVGSVMSVSLAVLAEGEELCLDCHEPAEDWEGMTAEKIYEMAADTTIKRHADNAEFDEAQLRAMIAALLAE
jgi:hypothetical protein